MERLDVVYAWVDGAWPGYRDELSRYAGRPVDLNPNRHRDNLDLLKYSLRSLEVFAPWIERIHLVTARPQSPSWLNPHAPGLKVIHHDELFALRHLPTFNSFAIESYLYLLPDLSPRFLYFNDDMVLGRTLHPGDVMTKDGRARIHLEWNPSIARRKDEHPWRAAIGFANELLDKAFGAANARRLVRHAPVLMEIQRWQALADKWPEPLEATRSGRFRSGDTFAPDFLYPYFCLATGHATAVSIVDSYRQAAYVGLDNRGWLVSLQLAVVDRLRPLFLTLNDNFDETAAEAVVASVRRFLESWFPRPSRFEKP
ncbi:MAG: hypothetical protein JJE39_01560 [Vicinamibacteria bacterium]|nr:hypothetical protein [Vicinamibacteria bacterium]